jgi:copper transport protein
MGRLAVAVWLSVAWVVLSCAPALAHATLIEASPPQGGKAPAPPERVELRFTEPVDAGFDPVVVRDAAGARVDEHDARVDPEDARVVLADLEKLPEGAYTVEWRITSIDGHVVEGRYGFAVGDPVGHGEDAHGAAGPRVEDRETGQSGRESAQGRHGGHPKEASPGQGEPTAGTEHGVALAATALLAGLAPFAALVWLPASGQTGGAGHGALRPFGVLAWVLLCVLAAAGVGELSAYAVRASEEPLGTGLFAQTLFGSRVGAVWLVRLGLALVTAAAITAAVGSGRTWPWWAAAGTGGLLLMTLTGLSHAAATGRLLPLVADWTHAVAAAVWMGGLLGFAVALFSGPLRGLPPDRRAKVRERSVRRFSAVATIAVVVLAATGLYATLLHVPSPQALVDTPYGRALLVKLGLLAVVLAIGASNFLLGGRGPFGRLIVVELLLALALFVATGFLTSLPPASGT